MHLPSLFFQTIRTNQPEAKMAFVCFPKQEEQAVRCEKRFHWNIILMQIVIDLCIVLCSEMGCLISGAQWKKSTLGFIDLCWLKMWIFMFTLKNNYYYHSFNHLLVYCFLVCTGSKVIVDCSTLQFECWSHLNEAANIFCCFFSN